MTSAERPSFRRASVWLTGAVWLLLLPLSWSLAREARRVVVVVEHARAAEVTPTNWRMGSPPVVEIAALLGEAGGRLPARQPVLFVPQPELGGDGQFAMLWAAYLLPASNWVYAPDVGLDAPVELALCWRTRLADPRFELVLESAHGALYRRRR